MMILAFQLISKKIEMYFRLIGRLQRYQQHNTPDTLWLPDPRLPFHPSSGAISRPSSLFRPQSPLPYPSRPSRAKSPLLNTSPRPTSSARRRLSATSTKRLKTKASGLKTSSATLIPRNSLLNSASKQATSITYIRVKKQMDFLSIQPQECRNPTRKDG